MGGAETSVKKDKDKLRLWQGRLERNASAYADVAARMDKREKLYSGTHEVDKKIVEGDENYVAARHVRNICAEAIESQIDSSIPAPKVTPRYKKDEWKAKIIEDMLRNEIDRLPFEAYNDMMERTVPIQGGAAWLVEWDNTKVTHSSIGEIAVTPMHPKSLVPQAGVFSGIDDMDYIILKVPQTKGFIKSKYGVDVDQESESDPDIRGTEASTADDMVTRYIAYYRNASGGIGLYSWVNDVPLEDIEDYQMRRLRRCKTCGAVEPMDGVIPAPQLRPDGTAPWQEEAPDNYNSGDPPGASSRNDPTGTFSPLLIRDSVDDGGAASRSGGLAQLPEHSSLKSHAGGGRKVCPYCGGTAWESTSEEFEEIRNPILRSDGSVIPGMVPLSRPSDVLDENGLPIPETVLVPTKVPYYKPDIYPVILQKSVSVYGQLLGDSDIDKIEDQQRTINRVETKIIDKLLKSGSYMSLPPDASLEVDADDAKIIRLTSPSDKSMIDVYDLEGNVSQDLTYLAQCYEEWRQTIGITDSFQGRKDTTATSGKAKEFAAAQSAGRMESKRVMKNAAYAALYEAMFKFKLSYADEPRPVVAQDFRGDTQYESFNRYDFLEQDAAGEWFWNDQFLFSTDVSSSLAQNREAMWQEMRMNLQTGAFGNPQDISTLILFWGKMRDLHYPTAGDIKAYLEDALRQQQEAAMMQQQQAARMAAMQSGQIDPQTAQSIEQAAMRQAAADVSRQAIGV